MANEARKIVESKLAAVLPYGVPQFVVARILESGGSVEDAYRELEDYEEEAKIEGFDLDFDIEDVYNQYEVINEIFGTGFVTTADEETVAASVSEHPELFELAELVEATLENPDDFDEFEMLIDDIDAAMDSLSNTAIDEILLEMDGKDSFIGLDQIIADVEKSIEEAGATGILASDWAKDVSKSTKPTIEEESHQYGFGMHGDPTRFGIAPEGGWTDPEAVPSSGGEAPDWIHYMASPTMGMAEDASSVFDPFGAGIDYPKSGDPMTDALRESIWNELPLVFFGESEDIKAKIREVGWDNFDWETFYDEYPEEYAKSVSYAKSASDEDTDGFIKYSDDWYDELSDEEQAKLETYLLNEVGLEVQDWEGYIERGSSPDIEFTMLMNELSLQHKTGSHDFDSALATAKEKITGFPGFPYDPTMVAGTGGTDDDDYDEDGKVIYDPRKHGSVTDSEGNKTPIPITGAFSWETWQPGTEPGAPGSNYPLISIEQAFEQFKTNVDWGLYFSEAWIEFQNDPFKYSHPDIEFTGGPTPNYLQWIGFDLQNAFKQWHDEDPENADRQAASLVGFLFTEGHYGRLGGLDQSPSQLSNDMLYRLGKAALEGKIYKENYAGGADDMFIAPTDDQITAAGIGSFGTPDGHRWSDRAATYPLMESIATLFGMSKVASDDEDKLGRGNIWALPSYETVVRGYDVNFVDLGKGQTAFGQIYLQDLLNTLDEERDKFDEAFTSTNPQLMGGVYASMRNDIFDDANMARFLNDDSYQEIGQRYSGFDIDNLDDPARMYAIAGWEQPTEYYEKYINNRHEESEKLYDNAFELADFLDESAWLAQGEDFARKKDLPESDMNSIIAQRFGLDFKNENDRRLFSLQQTFNPLLYKAGSDMYTGAESMIKQMALSATLPVGSTPQQRGLHRSMIDQKYNEWVNSNNNPNSFLKYWLESGRIISTRSSYADQLESVARDDPQYFWKKYLQEEWGEGVDPTRRYRPPIQLEQGDTLFSPLE